MNIHTKKITHLTVIFSAISVIIFILLFLFQYLSFSGRVKQFSQEFSRSDMILVIPNKKKTDSSKLISQQYLLLTNTLPYGHYELNIAYSSSQSNLMQILSLDSQRIFHNIILPSGSATNARIIFSPGQKTEDQSYIFKIRIPRTGRFFLQNITLKTADLKYPVMLKLPAVLLILLTLFPLLITITYTLLKRKEYKPSLESIFKSLFLSSLILLPLPSFFMVYLFITLILSMIILFKKKELAKFQVWEWILLTFIFFSFVSAVFAKYNGDAVGGAFIFLTYFLLYLQMKHIVFDKEEKSSIAEMFSWAIIIWGGFVLIHYIFNLSLNIHLGGNPLMYLPAREPNGILISIFQYGSMGAYLLALLSIYILHQLFKSDSLKKNKTIIVHATALILSILLMIIIQGRGALLLFAFSIGVHIVLYRKWKLLIALVLISTAILFVPHYKIQGTIKNITHPEKIPNVDGRLKQYKAGFALFEKYNMITGLGIANFKYYYKDEYRGYARWTPVDFLHNLYIGLLTETGILGALSFFSFLFYFIIFNLRKYWKDRYNSPPDPVLALTMAGGLLLISLFDAILYNVPLGIIFWMLMGISQNQSEQKRLKQ